MHKREKLPPKKKVGIRELRSDFSGYVKRARDGQIIEVTSRDQVVAELRPAVPMFDKSRRKPGTLKGRIAIAADFDKLPPELIDAFDS